MYPPGGAGGIFIRLLALQAQLVEGYGSIPYGYKRKPDDKQTLIVDEPAAEVVRKIFRLVCQGNSTTASLSADNRRGSSSRRESSRRAMAAVVKPRSCSAAVQSPSGR